MKNYDFKTLNDKEFELISVEMISQILDKRFERFKSGKDGGVDGRHYFDDGREWVVQCKHWIRTPNTKLIHELINVELPKVKKLNPKRYIIVVSNNLSRIDKSAIKKAFSPFILNSSDIYGNEDLNDFLAINPEFEQRHYKLWLSNASIISNFLNLPIINRSSFSIEEIKLKLSKFVQTSSIENAFKLVNEKGVAIITGEPGAGKSMLAEQLCLRYVSAGYRLYVIGNDIQEAESVFSNNEKAIFYFDDFLGRNYLDALTGHEGSKIVGFIKMVCANSKKKFILTSRTTILNQGKILIDLFDIYKLNRNEFEIRVSDMLPIEKGRLLYNHIYNSLLNAGYVNEIYKDKRYLHIIKHDNFNPRLIEFITDHLRFENINENQYWGKIHEILENPKCVWENVFEAQLDEYCRIITLIVTINEKGLSEDLLFESYRRFVESPKVRISKGESDILINVKKLSGSVLNRIVNQKVITYDLFNPSIGDYVINRYCKNSDYLTIAFLSLHNTNCLKTLNSIRKQNIINEEIYGKIISSLLQLELSKAITPASFDFEYGIELVTQILRNLSEDQILLNQAIVYFNSYAKFDFGEYTYLAAELFRSLIYAENIDQKDGVLFLKSNLKNIQFMSEFEYIRELIPVLPSFENDEDGVRSIYEEIFFDHFRNSISEDLHDNIYPSCTQDDLENSIKQYIEVQLQDNKINCSHEIINEILQGLNYESEFQSYLESHYDDQYEGQTFLNQKGDVIGSIDDAINDLFER